MGVSSLYNKEFALNIEDISCIVTALEVYAAVDRSQAIEENRDFDLSIQSTLTYLRDYENFLKRSEAKYVKLSHSI